MLLVIAPDNDATAARVAVAGHGFLTGLVLECENGDVLAVPPGDTESTVGGDFAVVGICNDIGYRLDAAPCGVACGSSP